MVTDMKMSDAGLEFLINEEGERLRAYKDVAGVWTIGVGHTGKDVHPGKRITKEESRELLRKDVKFFELQVNNSIKVVLKQHEFDACVSLAFNIGSFPVSSVAKFINDKKPLSEIERAFRMWNKITNPKTKEKEVNDILVKRREREIKLFRGEK